MAKKERKDLSVRQRIFLSNGIMVAFTLVLFLLITFAVVAVYSESIEHELEASLTSAGSSHDIEQIIKDFTVRRKSFVLLFLADGSLCVLGLIGISQFFTRRLTNRIVEPLNQLKKGALRIQNNVLFQPIEYKGEKEFENLCETFNQMQLHLLEEQEKNRRYEKARRDMTAGISHDLKTPLTAIRGTLKGLMDGVAQTPEQEKAFLNVACRRTEEIEVLLNRLLEISKLDTGSIPLDMQKIEIADYLKRYGENGDFPNGMKVVVDTGEVKASVMLDGNQMHRILNNLLENSRKYGEREDLEVKILLSQIDQDHIRIAVSDNGAGVSEDQISHIFEEFYRADPSRNEKKGSGLGLYIVQRLTEAMGGKVSAESDGGLTIMMDFPVVKEEDNGGEEENTDC